MKMKAAVYTKFGPPETIMVKEVKKPEPKKNQVLIRIHAGTVTAGDIVMRKAQFPLNLILVLLMPRQKIPGIELSGVVEKAGRAVTAFKKGDEVFGTSGFHMGSNAEFNCVPAKGLSIKPPTISFEEAAAISVGGITAVYYLRDKARLAKDQRVLIHGASGSVGSYAVQLAKFYGAHVTAVCSTSNVDWVKSLGADQVIDYTRKDFTQLPSKYDIIFDAAGKCSLSKCKKVLSADGKYVSVTRGLARVKSGDLSFLRELIEAGKIRPVIDKIYPLEQIAEGHSYVEKGHKKGNVVIKII